MTKLSEDLAARKLVQHHTFENLAWLDTPQTFYLGIDCSSDSLTIGNLMAFLVARRLLEAGWKTILLVGGATSLIGDPGGKESERELKSREEIQKNVAGIKKQVSQLFAGKHFDLVDNYDWIKDITYIDFLRDVGKHFSMTELVQREYVRERIGEGGSGISYAEFSYSLIQGYDFWYLFRNKGCILQLGGSDQWGNMVSGLPLIRKKEGKEAHALSVPLLVNKSTGKKFGKSEEGAIWLDPSRTSPFQMYQFLFNSEDDAVEEYLLKLTLLPVTEIREAMHAHAANPAARAAQRLLAHHVTALVHGEEKANNADTVSNVLFSGGDIAGIGASEREMLLRDAPHTFVKVGDMLVDVLVTSNLASSKREAREFIAGKAVSIAGVFVTDPAYTLGESDFASNGLALLKRGKRQVSVLTKAE